MIEPVANSYGGVLVSGGGLVLLREPTRHNAGYVWTFAKGRPEAGETPRATALRECARKPATLRASSRPFRARLPAPSAGRRSGSWTPPTRLHLSMARPSEFIGRHSTRRAVCSN
ncbi:MAG: NUDIX hydrolase [Betaproteobacteria bacterium]|nr:NUDIX hydrolase [Betaproteobacteria bacterium]